MNKEIECRNMSKKLFAMLNIKAIDAGNTIPFTGYVQRLFFPDGQTGIVVIEPASPLSSRRFNREVGYHSPVFDAVSVPVNKLDIMHQPNSFWMSFSEDMGVYVILPGHMVVAARTATYRPYNNSKPEDFKLIPKQLAEQFIQRL